MCYFALGSPHPVVPLCWQRPPELRVLQAGPAPPHAASRRFSAAAATANGRAESRCRRLRSHNQEEEAAEPEASASHSFRSVLQTEKKQLQSPFWAVFELSLSRVRVRRRRIRSGRFIDPNLVFSLTNYIYIFSPFLSQKQQ